MSTPHKEVLNLIRNRFDEFSFSYDREIPPVGIINYHGFMGNGQAVFFRQGGMNHPRHQKQGSVEDGELLAHGVSFIKSALNSALRF